MNPLSMQIAGFIVLFLTLIVSLAAVVAYLQYQTDLEKFRFALRPGDMVRLKTSEVIIKARIIRRNSNFSFVALDIDNQQQHLTAVTFIYMP